jgi:hypothetical protein
MKKEFLLYMNFLRQKEVKLSFKNASLKKNKDGSGSGVGARAEINAQSGPDPDQKRTKKLIHYTV